MEYNELMEDYPMTLDLTSEAEAQRMALDDGSGLRVVTAQFISETPFSWDLFKGYDTLKVLTYSGSIQTVFRLLDEFDFRRFECIFGCERVIGNFSDVLAFQQVVGSDTRTAIMDLKDERQAEILSAVISGRAGFYVLRKRVSHAKLYLLEDSSSGRRRVIYGSANLSVPALSGDQVETLVKHDNDPAAWEFFYRMYENVKADAADKIELPSERVTTANIHVNEVPVVKGNTGATLVIHEPDAELLRLHPQTQIEKIAKVADRNRATVSKIIPPARNGKQSIRPKHLSQIRKVKIVNSQEEADHSYLTLDSSRGAFDLSGRPFVLEWDEEKVRSDVQLMVKYFNQYEGAFVGDVPNHQRNYFILWSWMYFSPFMCDLRIRASLEPGGDVFRYPNFAIVYGKSACGKSKLIETVTNSMFNRDLTMPKESFTKSHLRALRDAYKRLPIYYDDIAKGALREHGFDLIKDPLIPGVRDEYPSFIISMNADFGSFPVEITRRTLMIYTDTALPAYNEGLRAELDPVLAEIQRGTTTHFFRKYAAEILERLRYDPLPEDWLRLSSGVLSRIIRDNVPGDAPEWSGEAEWDNYAGKMRFDRVRRSLDERLRPEAMLLNGSKDEEGWYLESDRRIIVISEKDNWGRRESYWEDVPSTLIDEDASYGKRIVLNRSETETFLQREVMGPEPSSPEPAEASPPEKRRRGLRARLSAIVSAALGDDSQD